MRIEEAVEAIEKNYPPSNYTRLREALDLSIKTLRGKEKLVDYIKELEVRLLAAGEGLPTMREDVQHLLEVEADE